MRKQASLVALTAAVCLAHFAPTLAQAQGYPNKAIRVIVPFTTGSATDILARIVAEKLNAAWGQPVVVENRPGAGGTIGAAQAAKSPPDGYTLLVVSTGHVVNHVLYANLQYDTLQDLAGVAPLASLPSVLAVSPALGVKSVRELVVAAKAKPGAFNYGTAGIGSAAHINSEKFRIAAGIDAVYVPFKGAPEILSETMGGRIQFAWVPIVSSMGPLRDGKLTPLAVSTPRRVAALPDPDDRRSGLLRRGIHLLGRHAGAGASPARGGREIEWRDHALAAGPRREGTPAQARRRVDVDDAR